MKSVIFTISVYIQILKLPFSKFRNAYKIGFKKMYNYVNRFKEGVYGHYQMCYVEIETKQLAPIQKDMYQQIVFNLLGI